MPSKHIIIFITASCKKEAQKIILALIRKRFIACGNVLGGVDSTFVWRSKIDKAKEALLILKTRRDLFNKVVREVKRLHSYEVPEIIAVPIAAGSREYLKWINEVVNA